MQAQSRLLNGILILGHVYLLPFPAFNSRADLRRALALVRLLIRVDRFSHAHTAAGSMLAGKAIEQARVALAAVAVAIAGLLVEYFLHSRRDDVSVLHGDVRELRSAAPPAAPPSTQRKTSASRPSPSWPPESPPHPPSRPSPHRASPPASAQCAAPISQTSASQPNLSRNPRLWPSQRPATVPRARLGRAFQIRTAGKAAESAAA